MDRICNSYPSNVKTTKGTGGDIIICEEIARMDPQVFYAVGLEVAKHCVRSWR